MREIIKIIGKFFISLPMMEDMNIYSKLLLLLSFIIFLTAEFYNEKAVYVAFFFFMLAFFLPHIITIVTGKHFRGE